MNFLRHKELTITIAQMDLKLRYQNSKIGFVWSLLKPLLQFCVYYTVFKIILNVDTSDDYPLNLFLGVVLWNFFVEATGNGINAYIGKKSLVTKVKIERMVLPIATYITALMNFMLTLMIFVIVYMLFGVGSWLVFSITTIAKFLGYMVLYSMLIISFNVVLATVNVLFRDMQNIWDLILMYGVFLTPIIYPLTIPQQWLKLYYFLNPLAYPIEGIKSLFFTSYTSYSEKYVGSFILSLAIWMGVAYITNKKLGAKVADYL